MPSELRQPVRRGEARRSALSKDAPEDSHWAAVGQAVSERMTELGFSQAEVTRRSYLTDNTIQRHHAGGAIAPTSPASQ